MMIYDAFISYSHVKDKPIAAALQSVMQRLGKPWYRRRGLRVFRDDTSLSATPGLWPSIEQVLEQSRFLILLASPEAATSPWVNKEVAYWLRHKSVDRLLIALSDGKLTWDNSVGDFRWGDRMPLPPALRRRFSNEPKWVDLTPYRDSVDPRDSQFIEAGADFAAALHDMPKEDLLSQEVRQQRRALVLSWSGAVLLLALTSTAFWQWTMALQSERKALAESGRAERHTNAAKSRSNALRKDGGAGGFRLYPANEAAEAMGILQGEYARNDSASGMGNVFMPDDELLTGAYSIVERGATGFGKLYASVHGGSAVLDAVLSSSTSSMMRPASFGRASFSGAKGLSMQCEFYRDDVTLHGNGACRTPEGALFRVEF
jgi:hypothetical protein